MQTRIRLLEVVHEIQVGERAAVLVNVVVAVSGNEDRTDIGNTGHVRGDQLLPKLLLPGGQVQLVDAGRHFAETIDKQGAPVACPRDRSLSRMQARNRTNLSALHS